MDLNDRKKAFENKFARDNEIDFYARMKAYRTLVRSIAEDYLKLNDDATQNFCDETLLFIVRHSDQDKVFEEIQTHLQKSNVILSNEELHKMYQSGLAKAYKKLNGNS